MKGKLITGDIKENTMTFEMEDEVVLKAGEYYILTKEEYNRIIKNKN